MHRNLKASAIAALVPLSVGLLLNASADKTAPTNTAVGVALRVAARTGACSATLQDGSVLITGGQGSGAPMGNSEIYNASAGSKNASSMREARTGHACATLPDGRVLVAGGSNSGGATNSVEIFNPANGQWTDGGAMATARSGAAAVTVSKGRVVVAGGESNGHATATIEIFDPASGKFTQASALLSSPRMQHATVALKDGRVLIAGGTDGKNTLDTIEMFDPTSGSVSTLPSKLSSPRLGLSATMLLDGRVFIAGGSDGNQELASTEIYDPKKGTMTPAAPMNMRRKGHLAIRVPNNNSILIAGGDFHGAMVSSVELYIPWQNTYKTFSPGNSQGKGGPNSTGISTKAVSRTAAAATTDPASVLPTLFTDQPDYSPGQTAQITGSGWPANTDVTLSLTRDPTPDPSIVTDPTVWTAKSDADGNLSTTYDVKSYDLNVTFTLTASASTGDTAQIQQTITFTDAPNSVTTLVSSKNPSAPGDAVTYTAHVTKNNQAATCGTVTFTDNGTTVKAATSVDGNGSVTYSPSPNYSSTGDHVIVASYAPASSGCNLDPSSATLTQQVRITTSTTLTVDPNPASAGQLVSLTATVNPNNNSGTKATGTVTFYDNGSPVTGAPTPTVVLNNDGTATRPVSFTGTGPHNITAAYSGDTIFGLSTSAVVVLTVNPACTAASITTPPSNTSVAYGSDAIFTVVAGGSPTPTIQWQSSSDGVNWTNISGATGAALTVTKPSVSQSGTRYRAVATNTCSGTQTAASSAATLTVQPRPITVTADAQSKTYGSADPSLTYQVTSGSLLTGDAFSGALTRAAGEAVAGGPYAIQQGTLSAGSNYALTFVPANLTINPKAASVTPNNASKTYGDSDSNPLTTGTLTGFLAADNVTAAYSRTSGESVAGSPYTISATLSPSGVLSNYTITSNTANFTINKKSLTVTSITASDKTYDSTTTAQVSNPVLSGVVGQDAVSATVSGANFADKNVGQHKTVTVAFSGLTGAAAGNYTLSTTSLNATANINPAALTLTAATNTKTYDGTTSAAATPTPSGLKGTDTVTGLAEAYADANAGTGKKLTVTTFTVNDGNSGSNYTVTKVDDNTGVINKATAAFANLAAPTITYGDASAALSGKIAFSTLIPTGSVNITVNGATQPATVGADGSFTSTFTTSSFNANTSGYTITYSYTGDTNFNSVSDNSKTLIVNKAQASLAIDPASLTATYDGTAKSATVTTTPANLTGVSVTYAGSSTAPANAGSYAVVASLNNTNYTASNATGALTINQATPTITATGGTFTYNGSAHPATGTITGVNGADLGSANLTFTYTPGGSNAPVSAGAYSVTASFAGNTNYKSVTSAPATITINKASSATGLTAPATAFVGDAVTFTASVTAGATGTVDFYNGATKVGSGTISNGTASAQVTAAAGGILSLTATYNGDNNFSGSTSNAASVTVSRRLSTTTAADVTGLHQSLPNQPQAAIPVSATVAPTGATGSVTFSEGTTVLAANQVLTNGQASFDAKSLGVGTHTITATYSGDVVYDVSSTNLKLTINNTDKGANISVAPWDAAASKDSTAALLTFSSVNTAGITGIQTAVAPATALPTGYKPLATPAYYNLNTTAVLDTASASTFTVCLAYDPQTPKPQNLVLAHFNSTNQWDLPGSTVDTTNSRVCVTLPASASSSYLNGNSPWVIVQNVATSTEVTSSLNPSTYGQQVTFTATVKSAVVGSANTPLSDGSGNVQFYDGANPLGSAVSLSSGKATYTTGAKELTAGAHSITAVYSNDTYYAGSTSASLSQTVNKANQTITFSPLTNKTYGDPAFSLTATSDSGLTVSFTATGGCSVSGSQATITAASPCAITASQAGDANYNAATPVLQTVQIAKAALGVTAADATRVYGTPNPAFTGTVTGIAYSDNITASYATTATTSSNAGNYSIVPTLSDNGTGKLGNYTVTATNGTLTITKATLTAKADDQTRAYGSANPAFTGTLTGVVAGDGITANYTTTATTSSDVGVYDITPQLSDPNSRLTNYNVTLTNGKLSISAVPLTITAQNASRGYGDPNPSFTVGYSGFVLSQTPAVLGGTLTFSTAAGLTTSVGQYPVTPAGLTSNNYTITFVPGQLTITQAPLSGTIANVSRLYGAANPASYTATYTGFKNSETANVVSGTITCTTAATQTSPIGDYPLTNCTGATATNYAITFVSGSKLSVTPAPLNVAAANATRVYGDANPVFTGTINGIVNNDAITATYSTTATPTTAVGAYDIVPSPAGAALSNYTVTLTNGKLTISAAPLTITVDNQTKIYGDANPTLTGKLVGVKNGEVITPGYSTTAQQYSSVGQYPITATLSGATLTNYTVTNTPGSLTISPKPITAVPNSLTRLYGASNPPFTAAYPPLLNGDTLASPTCSTTAVQTSAVGSYPITNCSVTSANYAVTFDYSGSPVVKVNPAPLTVTPNVATRVYGDPNPAFTGTVSGAVNGDVLTPTYSTTATPTSPVGGYDITATLAGPALGNYSVTYNKATLTVNPATLTIITDSKIKSYGDSNPMLTGTVSGVKNNETITVVYSTTATQNSLVGVYPITATPSGATLSNYAVTNAGSTLTVNYVSITTGVALSSPTVQYSDLEKITVTVAPAVANNAVPAVTNVAFYIGPNGLTSAQAIQSGGTSLGSCVPDPTGNCSVNPAMIDTPSNPPGGNFAPGGHTVYALFTVNPNFAVNSAIKTSGLTINSEDARATYTGAMFASTASATSSTATVTLSATVQDITAVTGDSATDANAGDIRNAKVTFGTWSNGSPSIFTPISGCSNLMVGLVTSSDPKTGTATCNWTADIGTQDSAQYTVGLQVSNYYARLDSIENTVVTVSKAYASSFITGGGYLTMTNSSGQYPGAAGTKNNFGFNVKYNKGGTNLQGNINTIIRNNGRVYQIKGNSMTSLSTSPNATGGTATFNGKANIQDITDPTNILSIDGNATLQVDMTDTGNAGTDTIAITVWNKSGGVWFSSNWSGTKTVLQTISGGNLSVR